MAAVLTGIQVFALIILFFETLYIGLQKPSRLQVILMVLTISTFAMMIGDILEDGATNIDAAYYGTILSYLGKPFTLLFAFLFILEYCDIHLSTRTTLLLVLYHSMYSVAVIHNNYAYLFYSSVGFDATQTFSPLVLTHGVLYYCYAVTIILYLIIGTVIVSHEFIKTKNSEYRKHLLYLYGVLFCGIFGYVVFMCGLTNGYDSTMLGCFFSTILLTILLTRYRMFSVVTLAKDKALAEANAGLIVIDSRGKTVYINSLADKLIKAETSIEEIKKTNEKTPLKLGEKYYHVKQTDLVENGRSYGTSYEIEDITDSYLYSARLAEDVRKQTEKIIHMQRSIIASFSGIVEARDDTTGTHIQRTSTYVHMLAEELRKNPRYTGVVDNKFIYRITDAAPMHDIGKITIPDSILMKTSKLTDEEYEVMKTHTVQGARIIEDTMRNIENDDYVEMAKNVALCHHERYDGKGYPNGLSGKSIPLEARIMAVADVFDALRAKRPYKDPFSVEETEKILIDGKGKQFDPDIIDAFLSRKNEFFEISSR